MCTQTVGLVQAELERRGITTVSFSQMRKVTRKIAPPRALYVPFPFGHTLGEANNPALQRALIEAALRLLPRNDVPVLEDWEPV